MIFAAIFAASDEAFIATNVGVIAAFVGAYLGLRKLNPERNTLIAKAADDLASAMKVTLDEVRRDRDEARDKIAELRQHLNELREAEDACQQRVAKLVKRIEGLEHRERGRK